MHARKPLFHAENPTGNSYLYAAPASFSILTPISTEDMATEITEVDKHQDWDELFACFWTAWANPPQVVRQVTFPHLGEGTGHESQSFRECKRLWLEATINNPNDYWGKAVDTETFKIVGGVGITFHEELPPQEKIRADWWEEESDMRELAEEMFERILDMRRVLMRGPHASRIVICPEYCVHVGSWIHSWRAIMVSSCIS